MTANDPVFPTLPWHDTLTGTSTPPATGLTKLEWFAGLAMQALIANTDTVYGPTELRMTAYAAAKAMLEPRTEQPATIDAAAIQRIVERALFHGGNTLSALSEIHELLVPADATEELPPVVRPTDGYSGYCSSGRIYGE